MDKIALADGSVLDCAEYPLPDGIEDCVLNQSQLARAMGTSLVTISSWIGSDMPVRQKGGNGQAYEFQLAHCFAWRKHREAQDEKKRSDGDAAANQLALTFLNDDQVAHDVPSLTAKDIKAFSEADYQRNKAAEMRGDLVRASQVSRVLEEMIVAFVSGVNVMPDFVEAEFGVTPSQAQRMQDRCDSLIDEMRKILQRNHLSAANVVSFDDADAS